MNFVRSKTFFITLGVLLIIGAVLFISFTGNSVKYGEADSSLEVIKRAQQVAAGEASRTDADKDGLYDWEETLWATDPQNPDTDGDGDSDGDEVDDDRNPTVPGPEDALEKNQEGDVLFPGEDGEVLTATDVAARSFFGEYLQLRQEGSLEDTLVQQDLFKTILNAIPKTSSYVPVREKDVLINQQTGVEAARNYANAVGALLMQPATSHGDPAEILLLTLQTDDESQVQKLSEIAESYEKLFSGLKSTVAPKDALLVHATLLNAVGTYAQNVRDMEQVFTDPVIMFGATTRYEQEAVALTKAIIAVKNYLVQNGATFENTEPGYLFMTITPIQ